MNRLHAARSGLGLLLALSTVLGGCLGGGEPQAAGDDPGLSGSVDVTERVANDPTFGEGSGAINGTVHNENHAALRDVHVVLTGTPYFTDSDKNGRFVFSDVPAGAYTLRAGLTGYGALEHALTVTDGVILDVMVTLVSTDKRGVGFRDHVHDFWGEYSRVPVFEGRLEYPKGQLSGGPSTHTACYKGPSLQLNGELCYLIPIFPEIDHVVPPGTASLDVTVEWEKHDYLDQVEFRYAPANETSIRRGLWMGPAETKTIATGDGMNDHGHQRYTLWVFQLFAPPTVADTVWVGVDQFSEGYVGAFQVKVWAVKGVVPTEPPHPDYWAEGGEVVLLDGETHTINGLPTARTRNPKAQTCTAAEICFVLPKNVIVPSGASFLRVTLEYSYGTPALASQFEPRSMAFRTAAVNPKEATLADLLVPSPTSESAGHVEWEIPLAEEDTDFFYQSKSTWLFLAAKKGAERSASYAPDCWSYVAGCGGDIFKLSVVAVNDEWTPPSIE